MIRLFGQTDTVFTSNGDVVITPIKARVTKKDNGDYYLSLETDLSYVDFLTEGRIIVANTPTGDQAFRVGNVTKTGKKITTKCYHVFYDTKNYVIPYAKIENKNGLVALQTLNSAAVPNTEYIVSSDIDDTRSYECIRKSYNEAIKEFIETWGGHLVRDNFHISIVESIGQDNGIVVQYKKNLKEISVQEDWKSVVTRLLPVGKDGILLNAVNGGVSVWVNADVQYEIPYTKTVQFQQKIDQRDYPDETSYKQALVNDLYTKAVNYVNENKIPKVNYTLKANLERLTDIGDTILVYDDRLGVELLTKVIGFEYDCISEKYVTVQFGNFMPTLSGFASQITASSEQIAKDAASAQEQNIIDMMSLSYVIYDGSKIMVVDRLPKETAVDVIEIDHNGVLFTHEGSQTAKFGIDGSLYLGNKELDDFITQRGTMDGWRFQINASGVTTMWKQVDVSSSGVTWSTVGSFSEGSFDVDYPFNLTDAVVVATMDSCTDAGWIEKAEAGAAKAEVSVLRASTTGTMTVNVMVRGVKS